MTPAALAKTGGYAPSLPALARQVAALEQRVSQQLEKPFFPFKTTSVLTAASSLYLAKPWDLVLVNPTSGAFTVKIQRPGTAWIILKNVSTSATAVTLAALDSTYTIEDAATYSMSGSRQKVILVPRDATRWVVL